MKYRSECKHGFTNCGCLHCAVLKALIVFMEKKRALKSRYMQFFLQNVQNGILKICKMFKNDMKFTRTARWMISKIINNYRTLTLQKICFICFNENPLKITKNAFYFILKSLLVLKIFKFLCCFFCHVKTVLIRKIRLISKFMTSQPG